MIVPGLHVLHGMSVHHEAHEAHEEGVSQRALVERRYKPRSAAGDASSIGRHSKAGDSYALPQISYLPSSRQPTGQPEAFRGGSPADRPLGLRESPRGPGTNFVHYDPARVFDWRQQQVSRRRETLRQALNSTTCLIKMGRS